MGHANPRNGYFEARYAIGGGRYNTVRDGSGGVARFSTRRLAKQAADHAEVEFHLKGSVVSTTRTRIHEDASDHQSGSPRRSIEGLRFWTYAESWLSRQDLARNTIAGYRSNLEAHLIPQFGEKFMQDIDARDISAWVFKLRDAGYKETSIARYRTLLRTILSDAYSDGLISSNPAQRKRGRGRRLHIGRGEERNVVIVNGLQALLIAERMALLSGRDDEFVYGCLCWYSGMRSGEMRGLEVRYVPKPTAVECGKFRHELRVQWQLVEVGGKFYKELPKDNSRRTIDLPHFLWKMLVEHVDRINPVPCECHAEAYVFSGYRKRKMKGDDGESLLSNLARSIGVSVSTVRNVLRASKGVAEPTRLRVLAALDSEGYSPRWSGASWHQHRSSYRRWLYTPAVSGRYPTQKSGPVGPVPILAEPFPGRPLRTRGRTRADACWAPIAVGMTPHGNRHSHRTALEEMGIPAVLINDRMGHLDHSVMARYTHATESMRDRLVAGLTDVWTNALDERLALCPTSPVPVLDNLLRSRAEERRRAQADTAQALR